MREEDFLKWFGGYFDHGAYCDWKIYHTTQSKTLADGTESEYESETLDAQIVFSGPKEVVDFIEENLRGMRHGKWEKNPSSKKGWAIAFSGLPEVRALARLLLPYSIFRKDDLNEIASKVDERIRKGRKWRKYRKIMERLDFEVGKRTPSKTDSTG